MNLLFISSEYPPQTGYGGIGTYTRITAESMAVRGHRVEVIALSETGTPYEYRENGVRVHRVGPGQHPLPQGRLFYRYRTLCRRFFPQTLLRLAWARSAAEKFAVLNAQNPFDLVESAECGAEAHYLQVLPPTRRVVRLHTPWVMAAELDRIDQGRLDLWLTGRLERKTVRSAQGITSPTADLARLLKRRWDLGTVACYPNPIEVQSVGAKTGEGDYIIYTGRVEYRKGVHVLIEAYANLRERGFAIPLKIVGAPFGTVKGAGDYGNSIEGKIRSLGLQSHVEWIRGARREEVLRLLRSARIGIFPSLWENFPYACLEAMAAGVPVVAARCGGYPEMIGEGESGLLFEAGSSESLAGAVARLLSDGPLHTRLSEGARRRVSAQFSIASVAPVAEAFYERVIRG